MTNRFTMETESEHGDGDDPPATVRVNLSIHFGDDTPPALAIGRAIGDLLAAGTNRADAEKIAQEIQEWAARRSLQIQAEADIAARHLLGVEAYRCDMPEGEPNAE